MHAEDGDAEEIPIRRGVEDRTHAVDHVKGGDRRLVGALDQIRHGPGLAYSLAVMEMRADTRAILPANERAVKSVK